MSGKFDPYWDSLEILYVKNKKYDTSTGDSLRKKTEAVDIISDNGTDASRDTVITRNITVNVDKNVSEYDTVLEYDPKNSLINKVKLLRRKSSADFYAEFIDMAKKNISITGEPCDYTPLNMYSPTYASLNGNQKRYYYWWRYNVRKRVFLKTDYSYCLLLAAEIINLGSNYDSREGQRILVDLWINYSDIDGFPYRLIDWICDYSLIHRLPPPGHTDLFLKKANALREYFVSAKKDDISSFVQVLLTYASSYNYKNSKFAKGEDLALFDKYIPYALEKAVELYSNDNGLLKDIDFADCRVVRDSFVGILCASREKYRLEVSYCSFSSGNELRFLVGDIVKYCENKIRAYIGVKSKLSVYLVSNALRDLLDSYFEAALPKKLPKRNEDSEKHSYDILYDVPKKSFSLKDAERIERESWSTTRELIEAFDEPEDEIVLPSLTGDMIEPQQVEITENTNGAYDADELESSDTSLRVLMGDLWEFVLAIKEKDKAKQRTEADRLGKISDALADRANELFSELYGDILIEDNGDGFEIIEDYIELIDINDT